MFNLFRKTAVKEVDKQKVNSFVEWFLEHGDKIIESMKDQTADRQKMFSTLDEVERQLALVYRDGYKGNIEFEYGGKADNPELYLYHNNNLFLIKAVELIANTINNKTDTKWRVYVSK
jgi:hypothetical protein